MTSPTAVLRKLRRGTGWLAAGALAALLASPAAIAVDIEWIPVGHPGNPPRDNVGGAVAYEFQIGRFEVTNAEYAEFLNAVAAADSYGLYDPQMGSDPRGGITRSGSSGSFHYAARPGRADLPVVFVSFPDALRFANWLHNGQPRGAQDASSTEDGAYTLLGQSPLFPAPRTAAALVFVASYDEWLKAACYDGNTGTWFEYPNGTDLPPVCEPPPGGANSANCWAGPPLGDAYPVGSYPASTSPSGSSDQLGNVAEWTELFVTIFNVFPIQMGLSFGMPLSRLKHCAAAGEPISGSSSLNDTGFRVARVAGPACADGIDDDGDGLTDHPADPGCASAADGSEKAEGDPALPCDDGEDDDGDGFVDATDPACSSGNPFVRDPFAPAEQTACQDGADNDAAPGTDFDGGESILGAGAGDPAGPDPQCAGRPWKHKERQGCGLGFELALLLPALAWLRRKSRYTFAFCQ